MEYANAGAVDPAFPHRTSVAADALSRRRSSGGAVDRLAPLLRRAREYVEVSLVIAAITVAGWYLPFSYRAFGHVYLLALIMLCLRVGRSPALFGAVVSALAWNYVIMPPRLSFSVLHLEDTMILGTYFVVALIAGQLTTRIRGQERLCREGEVRATALFHLTRALAAARSLDEAAESALTQADRHFGARTALLLADAEGRLQRHRASTGRASAAESMLAGAALTARLPVGRSTEQHSLAEALYLPLVGQQGPLGVFVVAPERTRRSTPIDRELAEAFAGQIALFVERQRFREASEREKLLAESDRLHRTLFDSVSHELKTPLAVLRAAAEGLGTRDERKQAAMLAEIRTAIRRLDRLVANLLNQTRLESGMLRPDLQPCDIRDVVSSARRGVEPMLGAHPLSVRYAPDLPLILADAPLLEQALANLLLNAILYTPPATPISIEAAPARDAPDRAILVVADRGPGLPPEVRAQVFAKFSRGRGAPAGGIGLGLSLVRGFVRAQGGEVHADDNPGGGARFTLILPIAALEPCRLHEPDDE